jgi:hypothetical protein
MLQVKNVSFIAEKQCHKIFRLRFFYESSTPKPPKITLGSFQIFVENSRRYSQVKVHHGINDKGGKFATGVSWLGCPRKWHFGIPRNTEVISGAIPAKFRGIPRNFGNFAGI